MHTKKSKKVNAGNTGVQSGKYSLKELQAIRDVLAVNEKSKKALLAAVGCMAMRGVVLNHIEKKLINEALNGSAFTGNTLATVFVFPG